MDENEWEVSSDLAAMLYRAQNIYTKTATGFSAQTRLPLISNRKLRLWVEACRASGEACDYCDLTSESGLHVAVEYWRSHDGEKQVPMAVRANILRDVIGNPFRPVTLPYRTESLPNNTGSRDTSTSFRRWCPWLTPTVVSLAQAAYDERLSNGTLDPHRLLVLADALEEVGCSEKRCSKCNGKGKVYDPQRYQGEDWYVCWDCVGKGSLPHPILVHLRSPGPHFRGCWLLDLLLKKE